MECENGLMCNRVRKAAFKLRSHKKEASSDADDGPSAVSVCADHSRMLPDGTRMARIPEMF